jgi:N6-adenosine-specific RNA methylase IME4
MLAVRGKPVFLHGNHATVLEAARREHSRKPEEFYALVEATSPGGKLELFCRQQRTGFLLPPGVLERKRNYCLAHRSFVQSPRS